MTHDLAHVMIIVLWISWIEWARSWRELQLRARKVAPFGDLVRRPKSRLGEAAIFKFLVFIIMGRMGEEKGSN